MPTPAACSAVLIANVVDITLLVIVLLENTIPPCPIVSTSCATGLPFSSSGISCTNTLLLKLSLLKSIVSQRIAFWLYVVPAGTPSSIWFVPVYTVALQFAVGSV